METLWSWSVGIAWSTWRVAEESAPYVLLGFLMAGLIRGLLRPGMLTKHLGQNNMGSVIKAALIGIPIPLCSCGVTAAAGAIHKQGTSRGATAAFLIATPETGVDSISITYALLDPVFTVVRPIAAFITAAAAGFAEVFFDRPKDEPVPVANATSCCGTPNTEEPTGSCCSSSETAAEDSSSMLRRLREGIRFSFVDLLAEIGPLLLLGLLLAGGISWAIPDGFFERFLGNETLSMLVMLVAGIPLYVCATASTPIAAALIAKGLSPGAGLVFLLAGPATNAATIAVVAKLLGKRSAVIYVSSIAVCSLLLGLALNWLYAASGVTVSAIDLHEHSSGFSWLPAFSVFVLVVLVVRSRRLTRAAARPATAPSSPTVAPPSSAPQRVQIGMPKTKDPD